MLLKRLYPSSFHHRFTVIRVLLALTLILVLITSSATTLSAQDEPITLRKTTCLSALGYEKLDLLKADLILQAKKEAINELFGELIVASTTVDDLVVTNDQILASSVGFVRVKDGYEYFHGEELADVCILIDAYITEEDRQKLEPIALASSEECIPNENLSLRELKQVAENRVVLSALQNRYPELVDQDEEKVLLLLKNKVFEGELDGRTGAYCTSVSGQSFPLEVQTFLSEAEQVADESLPPELVIGRLCNLRTGPGTNFEIVDTANTGDRLIVVGANADNTWWQSNYNNQDVWVSEICVDPQYPVMIDANNSKSDDRDTATVGKLDSAEGKVIRHYRK